MLTMPLKCIIRILDRNIYLNKEENINDRTSSK